VMTRALVTGLSAYGVFELAARTHAALEGAGAALDGRTLLGRAAFVVAAALAGGWLASRRPARIARAAPLGRHAHRIGGRRRLARARPARLSSDARASRPRDRRPTAPRERTREADASDEARRRDHSRSTSMPGRVVRGHAAAERRLTRDPSPRRDDPRRRRRVT